MTLPTFLIIGAAKAGTTALYQYLDQHPDVYLSPQKETNFFVFQEREVRFSGPGDRLHEYSITDMVAYEALFSGAKGQRAIGEASPLYLYYYRRACEGIRHHIPGAKLLAILRNPVERAYSAYLMMVRAGREPLKDFEAALDAEEGRIQQGWSPIFHYKRMGYYFEPLQHYLSAFGPEQLKVLVYDDFARDTLKALRETFEFLEVDPSFVPDVSHRPNISGIPVNPILHRLLSPPHWARRALKRVVPRGPRRYLQALRARNLERPRLAPHTRHRLVRTYREDIRRLEGLLQRDLGDWLAVPSEASRVESRVSP